MKKVLVALLGMILTVGMVSAAPSFIPDIIQNEFKILRDISVDSLAILVNEGHLNAGSLRLEPYKIDELTGDIFHNESRKNSRKLAAAATAAESLFQVIKSELNYKSCLAEPTGFYKRSKISSCSFTKTPAQVKESLEQWQKRIQRTNKEADSIMQDYQTCTLNRSWGQSFLDLFRVSPCMSNRENAFKQMGSRSAVEREQSEKAVQTENENFIKKNTRSKNK